MADRPSLESWLAETLGLTAFPAAAGEIIEQTWWADLTGAPPDATVTKPKEGARRDEGPFAAGKLTLLSQPSRIDWLYTAPRWQGRRITMQSIPSSLLNLSRGIY